MLLNFGQLKASNIIEIAGVTPNSTRFKSLLNEAVERLLVRGDSDGTVVPIQICVRRGCVVMPRYVANIREAKLCNGTIFQRNEWYTFVERGYYDYCDYLYRCERSLIANGRVPTFQSILGSERTVRAYAQTNQDHGKTITIFGVDNGNQPLMHRDSDGAWVDGWVLTLGPGYAETTGYVSRIDRVIKQRTQKNVTMFGWNAADSVLETLATYEPGDENPNFARYQLNLPPCKDDEGNEQLRNMTALVKLQYFPVEFDTDLVLISSMAALKLMIQGILAEEGNNDALAQAKITKAIQELNFVVRDNNFNQQVSVASNSVGSLIFNPI